MTVESFKTIELIRCIKHEKIFNNIKEMLKHIETNIYCFIIYTEIKIEEK